MFSSFLFSKYCNIVVGTAGINAYVMEVHSILVGAPGIDSCEICYVECDERVYVRVNYDYCQAIGKGINRFRVCA